MTSITSEYATALETTFLDAAGQWLRPPVLRWTAWRQKDSALPGLLFGYGPTEQAAIENLQLALGELVQCPRCAEAVEPHELRVYEERNREPGSSANSEQEYCVRCDPARLEREREAADEAEFWDRMEEF